jgi:MFS family permease
MWVLILGRAVQGLGGGGLLALAQTVIGDLYPPRERGKIAGYIAITWATASIAGPMLGGFITEHLSWPVIFWLNLPLAAVALLMASRALERLPWQRREHRLDTMGAVLVILTTVMFLLALALAPQPTFGWSDQRVLGLLAAGAMLLPVLIGHMLRTPEPLIPLDVLGNPIVLLATSSLFFGMAASIGLTVFIPLFLELALGLSPSEAGLGLVAYMIGAVAGASFAGQMLGRIEHYKRLPVAGLASASIVLAWLAIRAGRLTLLEFEGMLVLAGICSGQQFPIVTVCVQNAVDPRDIGVATGVLAFMRALGSSIGIAVFGAVAVVSGIAINIAEHGVGPGAKVAVQSVSATAFAPIFAAASFCLAMSSLTLGLMPARPLQGGTKS